jgi:hypothetical protein
VLSECPSKLLVFRAFGSWGDLRLNRESMVQLKEGAIMRPATELTRLWELLIWQDNLDYMLVAATVYQRAAEEHF